MLAQNFKSSADLGITDAELDALIKVLGMLERDEIQHAQYFTDLVDADQNPKGFNMSAFYGEGDCGTVCCIAGWAETVGRITPFELADRDDEALQRLFLPAFGKIPQLISYESITPDQAAIALRSYLTTGEANWAEALAVT